MKGRFSSLLLALFSLLAIVSTPQAADEEWVEGRSKHFAVISNAKPKQVEEVTGQLEEFRFLLTAMFPGLRLDPPIPTAMLLFKNDKAFRPYQPLTPQGKPQNVTGYFQPGVERMYLAVSLGASDPKQIAFHEYVHLILHLNFKVVPVWLDEGLAMFYQSTEIDGAKIKLGFPLENYWQLLQERSLLPLDLLTRVDQESEYYNVPDKKRIFYAESWLLVHYLMAGQGGQRQEQLTRFVQLLHQGLAQDEAFTQAFQANYKQMQRLLENYVRETTVQFFQGRMKAEPEKTTMAFEPMGTGVARAYLSDLWINSGRVDEAEKALKELTHAGAAPPEVLFRLGRIALARQQPEAAEEHFRAALAHRPNDIALRYYAALALSLGRQRLTGTAESRAAADQVIEYLSPILDAKTDFPGAYELLLQARLMRNDPPEQMIPVLERFRELMPQQRDFDLMLAQSYINAERYGDAEKLLEEIVHSSAREQDILQAKQWLERLQTMRDWRARGPQVGQAEEPEEEESGEEPGATERTTRPRRTADPVEPPPASPVGAPRVDFVQGRLQGVVCVGDGAVLTVQPDPKDKKPQEPVVLRVRSLSRLLIIDPADTGQKLGCGLSGVPVAINYRVESDDPEVAGVVMTVEFSRPRR